MLRQRSGQTTQRAAAHCRQIKRIVRLGGLAAASNNTASTSESSGKGGSKPEFTPTDYLSPFSAVDPSMKRSPQPSKQQAITGCGTSNGQQQDDYDPWKDVLSTNHTLSSLYLQQFQAGGFA